MSLFRIGEFAKHTGVTIDFIRFYEEAGILFSVIDESNHYHYYDFSQSETVFKIKYFRRLGFSVKETVRLLHSSSQAEQLRMFRSQADEQRRIRDEAECFEKHLRQLADMLSRDDGTWYVSLMPPVWFLPHTEDDLYLSYPNLQEQLAGWERQIPYTFSLDRWIMNSDGSLKTIQHGRGIDANAASALPVSTDAPAMFFPEKRCLEYYSCLKVSENRSVPLDLNIDFIEPALNVLRSANMTLEGDVFVRSLSIFFEGDGTRMKTVIYLPVR